MVLMGLAYPTPPRGSHKGVPLRLRRPPLSCGHFPHEWGQPVCPLALREARNVGVLRHHLSEDVGEEAAVLVVFGFDGGVYAAEDVEGLGCAVVRRCGDGDC